MIKFIRSSLRWKLLSLITSILLLVIATIGIFSFVETSKTIQSDVERFSTQIIKQANLNLSRYNRDNEQFFTTIGGSKEFYDWMVTQPGDRYDTFYYFKQIEQKYIEPFVKYHPEVLSVRLYSSNGNESIYRTPGTKYNLIFDIGYSMVREPWLQELKRTGSLTRMINENRNYTDAVGRPVETPVLTFVQAYRYLENDGYLAVDISLMPTKEILQEIQLGSEGESLIVDRTGQILAHSRPDMIRGMLDGGLLSKLAEASSGSFFWENREQLVIYESVPQTDWKVLVSVPYRDVAQSIYTVKNMTILIAIIGFLISLVLVFIVSGSITQRIKKLRQAIKVTDAGKFDVRVQVNGMDEVAELAGTYNRLLDRIDTSIREVTDSRILQQEAVLSALQSQINSHFLYNALESINSMANLADHVDISQTAVALSNMLRYTSNYRDTVVTLADEITHLRDYMHIIGVLYGTDVQYTVEMPEELHDVPCLKAIIQPFVENSLKHGFEVTGEPMTIAVRVERWRDRYVRISIHDNGTGIREDKLAELREALAREVTERDYKQLTGIGILNVHYRLKLYYPHPEAGVAVMSEVEGTIVRMVIPIQWREGQTA